jgi:phospholipase C
VQENRTVDNLFNGFPGADTVRHGKNSRGETLRLHAVPLASHYELSHEHSAWIADYNQDDMNGFNTEDIRCRNHRRCPDPGTAAYGYVPKSDVLPYWEMAKQYVLADKTFQTNQGPSFPAHQYLLSGTSTISNGSTLRAAENPQNRSGAHKEGGCDSLPSTRVVTIDQFGREGHPVFPCFTRNSILDLLNAKGIGWRYYQAFGGAGLWHGPDALKQIRHSRSYANVKWPPTAFLSDVRGGTLAAVTFVTPTAAASDHAGRTDGSGPSWVADIVNTVGESKYWHSTAIFVTWDDWGGWYEHVTPPKYNSYELGFRVPLIAIGPYAKKGYISHRQHEFGSLLKFIEEVFALPSLDTTDVRSDDLSDCFDFSQTPRTFVPIQASLGPDYFLSLPPSNESPDDD